MGKIKKYVAMALVGLTCVMSFSGCDVVQRTKESKGKTVLAEVDGEKITLDDVNRYLYSDLQTYEEEYGEDYEDNADIKDQIKELRENMVETLVKNKVCEMKAKEFKVVPDDDYINAEIKSQIKDMKAEGEDDYKKYLEQYNVDEDGYKDLLKHQIIQYAGRLEIQSRATKDLAAPTADELSEAYTNYVDTSTQLEAGAFVSHILFTGSNAEKNCKKAKELVDEGKSFEEIASMKEFRMDATYQELGHLTFENSGVVTEFEDAFKTLPVNQVSEPVKTSYGWHLILNEKINNEAIDATQEDFTHYLTYIVNNTNKQQALVKKVQEYEDALVKDGTIVIYSDRL